MYYSGTKSRAFRKNCGSSDSCGHTGFSERYSGNHCSVSYRNCIDSVFLIHGNSLYRNLVAAMPKYSQKRNFVVIGRAIQFQISRYVFLITIINALLGLATALVLMVLGVQDPFLWGALAMLFNYIPYIGPFAVTILLTFVGFTEFGSGMEALKLPVVFMILNNLECQFLTPMVLGKKFKVNPLIVVLWLLVVGWMWGVTGMILAVPLLVSVKVLVSQLEGMRHWRKVLS